MRPMLPIVALIALSTFSSACTTIQIPLPGTTILRPRAGVADAGARISVGSATAPSVEGTIDEVKDSNGFVINPLPGTKDDAGYEIAANSPLPVVELGVDWSKRFEFGLSSSRGFFFMWDYALWDHASLTLTPSYSSAKSEGGDPKFSTAVDSQGQDTLVLEHSYEGKATNFNVTQLGSVWLGNVQWAAIYAYAGIGANVFNASITQKETKATSQSSRVAPSVLAGLHVRLLIFELTVESGATTVEYRDGSKKSVPTGGGTFALHIAI